MKKLFLLPLLILIPSCSSMFKVTVYETPLISVESPKDSKQQYGETKIVPVAKDDGTTTYEYEDDYIKIVWSIGITHFNFNLTNKTGYSIKLPWDEMAYINYVGESKRIIHSGIKYIEREAPQAPTVVAKGAMINDMILPADGVKYVSIGSYGEWSECYLFPQYTNQVEADKGVIKGKTVSILFPIVIQDVTNEYTFTFELGNATVKPR